MSLTKVTPALTGEYKTVGALLASTEASRGVGAIWEAGGFRYTEVAASGDVTTAGSIQLDVVNNGSVCGTAFGAVGDGVADDTAAILLYTNYCKSHGIRMNDTHDNLYRITSVNGVWLGSADTANTVRGATLNILVDVDDGVAFDLVGIQNGERDDFDLRYEVKTGKTAQHGVVMSRPFRAATPSVYSSGNFARLKVNGRGAVYGAPIANFSSESNKLDGCAIFNPNGLTLFIGKDDWFVGKVVMTMSNTVTAYVIGETVTGATSGATGKVLRMSGSRLFIEVLSGLFQTGETVNGATGARGIVSQHLFTKASPNVNIETDDGATSTFQNIENCALYNDATDNLWPVTLQRQFNDVRWVTPNVNHAAGVDGDLMEFHGDVGVILDQGYLHAAHRYSIVCGDVHDATSQVFDRVVFKGLNAGSSNTARLKVMNDNVRFEAPIIDLDGDLDFAGGDVFGNAVITLGANALTSTGRIEGEIKIDSGASDLTAYTSASDDKRALITDAETGVFQGRREVSQTIAVGHIAVTGQFIRVFAESGTADDLTHMDIPDVLSVGPSVVYLQLGAGTETITLKPGVGGGNIRTAGNVRVILKVDVAYPFIYDPRQDEFSFAGMPNADTTQTGFTAMTGTVRKGTVDTATVTTAQLAERVFALESALFASGGISV